jgi:hypothetical protein
LSPAAKPKRRFRILRWLWRLTYLSALGLTGYITYQIWYLRNPTEQMQSDPKKKTLVVLGMLVLEDRDVMANGHRYWLGRGLAP